jgi:hypothetical protein
VQIKNLGDMRYFMLIVLVGLLGSSACEGDDPIGLTVLDNKALAEMEIAYQGAQDAISRLKEAIEHDEENDVITSFDSLFHLHYESFMKYNEEFSHSLQSDHFHDSDHGIHLNSNENHSDDDGHDEEENNDDSHGEDGNNDEGHDDENNDEGEDHDEDGGHHNSNEHHAEDHEDMDQLMEEHDLLNVH